jgi:hypothetical protein
VPKCQVLSNLHGVTTQKMVLFNKYTHHKSVLILNTNSYFTITKKNTISCDVMPYGSLRTDVSEECIAFIRVTRIGKLGTTLAVTSD